MLLGHEGAGVVESVGEGVELAVGDHVVLGWRSPCGECRWCARGDQRRCRTPPRAARRLRANGDKLFQTLQLGTFATRTVVHESAAIRIPEGLPPEQACLIGCAVATGVGSVLETAQVWEGARVAVIGCGAVGLSAVQGARIAGASEIYALDLDERKLQVRHAVSARRTSGRASSSTSCSTSSAVPRRSRRAWRCSATRERSSTSACRSRARAPSSS